MKLCIDCRNCVNRLSRYPQCGRTSYVDPVNGNRRHYFCETERYSLQDAACGPGGRHFDAAEVVVSEIESAA